MELLITDTNIYDLNLYDLIDQEIKSGFFDVRDDMRYNLEVIFHVELLNDRRLKEYYHEYVKHEPVIKMGSKDEQAYYEYLHYVIHKVHEVFENNNIKIRHMTIAGENMSNINSIMINLEQGEQIIIEPEVKKRGRKREPKYISVCSVVPSRAYTTEVINRIREKGLNKRFKDYLEIGGIKIMSQILDINITDDVNVLFREFINKYAHLWSIHGENEEDELHKKFFERVEYVGKKYYSDDGANDEISD